MNCGKKFEWFYLENSITALLMYTTILDYKRMSASLDFSHIDCNIFQPLNIDCRKVRYVFKCDRPRLTIAINASTFGWPLMRYIIIH